MECTHHEHPSRVTLTRPDCHTLRFIYYRGKYYKSFIVEDSQSEIYFIEILISDPDNTLIGGREREEDLSIWKEKT